MIFPESLHRINTKKLHAHKFESHVKTLMFKIFIFFSRKFSKSTHKMHKKSLTGDDVKSDKTKRVVVYILNVTSGHKRYRWNSQLLGYRRPSVHTQVLEEHSEQRSARTSGSNNVISSLCASSSAGPLVRMKVNKFCIPKWL